MKKLLITTEVITIFLLMAFLPPGGNTYNSSQNGNWTNAATWGGAGSPSANDDVANISHDVTLNANVSNRISITVNAESNLTGPTFDITIKSGATFVVSGTVECDDLTLDNGSEVLVNEGGEIIVNGNFLNKNNSDDVTVNGEITVGGWFDNGNGGEITGDGGITVAGEFRGAGTTFGVSPTSSIPDGTRASGAELPVELTAFHAAFSGSAMKGVDLMWTTASEFNNDYFEIEKSYDGADFEYVTRTKGAGTTNSTQEYTAYDPEMPTTTVYYRLKQTDYDGKYSLSSIFALNPQKTGSGCDLTVKPNPCIGRCIVSIENCPDANFENAVINVYDALGNVVYSSMPEVIEEGSAAFALDATNGFKPSVYFIRGSAGNNVMNKKIVIKN